jgi:hypothetical protein
MAPAAGEPSAAAGGGEGDTEAHAVIDVSSSETDSDPDPGFGGAGKRPRRVVATAGSGREAEKRARILAAAVPPGFLDPLPRPSAPPPPPPPPRGRRRVTRQFWNAGDYDGKPDLLGGDPSLRSDSGMDHIRVHPRFLHSNATSHKWALGGTVYFSHFNYLLPNICPCMQPTISSLTLAATTLLMYALY